MTERLLLAYYGDDFTGSTDALEFLCRAGAKTMLFIEPPSKETLERFEGLQAIGVAGMTRAMAPEAMERTLKPAFEALKTLNPIHVHYKVCSTFDSAPHIGSIGKAIDTGAEIFKGKYVPLVVAAPALGRHCVFGNLFAKMGIGSEGAIHRLDRHPSMSKHPITPATESDLRLHLSKQTSKKSALVDILQIEERFEENRARIESLVEEGNDVILFDGLYQHQMAAIGQLIHDSSSDDSSLFSVGSSGIEMALGAYWKEVGTLVPKTQLGEISDRGPILVVSGSCSPVSSRQISVALENGFKEIALDTELLVKQGLQAELFKQYVNDAVQHLAGGFDVIIHTSLGNEDPRVLRTGEILKTEEFKKIDTALVYGTALGRLARSIGERTRLERIIVAGGDTSSYAARAMGIEAVEMVSPLAPGAPMCRAYAPGSSIDGKEVNFKGGQVGKEDYYLRARGRK
ncbi:four-carbon acid sugar kinase family protein [Desertivirga brevis]|uniref:four-carbon acid sugar kinase family protein n=1 Tax=Desertivirga brevis TaxID=2810310 RepID=UPI001A97C81F|nr:four-carbon acid sugar kinase family protein [Pedobacter sp. SYSU D00873]